MPDTKVLAKVYQLYMVLNQCASILISHSHGMVEPTVSANKTINMAAQTVLFHRNFLPSSCVIGVHLMRFDNCLIFHPTKLQTPSVTSGPDKKEGGVQKSFFIIQDRIF